MSRGKNNTNSSCIVSMYILIRHHYKRKIFKPSNKMTPNDSKYCCTHELVPHSTHIREASSYSRGKPTQRTTTGQCVERENLWSTGPQMKCLHQTPPLKAHGCRRAGNMTVRARVNGGLQGSSTYQKQCDRYM